MRETHVSTQHRILFRPFALDLVNQCLWKDSDLIKLRPKAFGVLERLVGRAGRARDQARSDELGLARQVRGGMRS